MCISSDQLKIIRYAIRTNSRPNPSTTSERQISFIANKTVNSLEEKIIISQHLKSQQKNIHFKYGKNAKFYL
jgi:hypothetical protein